MNPSELLAILARGEDSYHQFKGDFTNIDSLAAELIAFANGGGGHLLIGVKDDGKPSGLTGADVARLNQLLSNAASQNARPPINPVSNNIQTGEGLVQVLAGNVPSLLGDRSPAGVFQGPCLWGAADHMKHRN